LTRAGERDAPDKPPDAWSDEARFEGVLPPIDQRDVQERLVRMKRKLGVLEEICSERRHVDTEVLEHTVALAVEIAREGREGRKIGTLFVVGDSEEVLKRSRPMILDPLRGHPEESKRINDPDVREPLKELAQLDGAFVVSDEGVVVSAARYIDATSESLSLPLGLGSRHVAAASVSKQTGAVAVAVSESSMVRMFDDGELVSEIIPELWMFDGYTSRLQGETFTRREEDITVIGRAD
jgi:DNA integrity scanning protein DisA with diadenylate cyclase activity